MQLCWWSWLPLTLLKRFSFLVQEIDKRRLNAAGDYEKGRVLDGLQFLNKGWWGVGEPNWSCIYEKGPDKGHICDKYGFFFLIPVGISKGLEDVDTG